MRAPRGTARRHTGSDRVADIGSTRCDYAAGLAAARGDTVPGAPHSLESIARNSPGTQIYADA